MRVAIVLLGCALSGCSAELVPVPEDCQVTVLDARVSAGFEWRLRVVVFLDGRVALPADVGERLSRMEETLRTGDVDGDGTAELRPPFEVEMVVVETTFEQSLPELVGPHLPEGFLGARTELVVVLVTTGDLPGRYVEEADRALELHPRRLTVVGVAGVPPDLTEPYTPSYEDILADPRMAPGAGPVCTTGGVDASPAVDVTRLVSRFSRLGADAALGLICADDWDHRVLGAVWPRGTAYHGGGCLPRALPRLPDGSVPCTLVEVLHPDDPRGCDHLPGRTASAEDPGGRCPIEQVLTPDAGSGWYYDDSSVDVAAWCGAGGRWISFTDDVAHIEGATYHLRCVTETGHCAP